MNALFQAVCGLSAVLAITILGYVLWFLFRQGITYFKPSFFTNLPDNVNPALGGIKHSIIGSLNLLGIALCISLPIGILSGVYQAESSGKLSHVVRFLTDVLNGIPSIVVGLFIYAIWILPYALKHPGQGYSGIAGGTALGIMMIPLVMRTTDEMLRLVPQSLWDASLALGTPRWRTMLLIVLPAARSGIVTGVMLALARVSGETLVHSSWKRVSRSYYWPNGCAATSPLQVCNVIRSGSEFNGLVNGTHAAPDHPRS
jgi:phosphate transport system permease protein